MANNNKVNRSVFVRISIFLLILMLSIISPSYAANYSAVALTSDLNSDGVAGIGDTITITVRAQADSVYATANPNIGFTLLDIVPMGNNVGGMQMFSAVFEIPAGNTNGDVSIRFYAASGTQEVSVPGCSIRVNNKRPSANTNPKTNLGSGIGGMFINGDKLIITHTLNNPTSSDKMEVDLSPLGLGIKSMSLSGSQFTSGEITLPTNREENGVIFTVTARNSAGNSQEWQTSPINIDTIVPEFESATLINTSGRQYVNAEDTLRVQAMIEKWDTDTVYASNTLVINGGRVKMTKMSGNVVGQSATFQADVPMTQSNIEKTQLYFQIIATDDAGNKNEINTNFITLDTLPPEFSDLGIKISSPAKGKLSNVAIMGDNLEIYGEMSQLMKDITLTVDLSGIGGVTNQIIPFTDGSTAPNIRTTTFRLNYTIGQYTSEDNIPRAFTVTAKDMAGNIITEVAMPIIYVDNQPPVISAGQFLNISSSGQPVKLGDQIAITRNGIH